MQSGTSETQLPQWVQDAGAALYQQAQPLTQRPYPVTSAEQRIAPFSADTQRAFDLSRANVGSYLPSLTSATSALDTAITPVGSTDIARYMNPYTEDVVRQTTDLLNRQAQQDTLRRHGQQATSGSFLNEDRRNAIDIAANEARDRTIASTASKLYSDAFTNALGQANIERARALSASPQYGAIGEALQKLGYGDVAALSSTGAALEGKDQLLRDLNYQIQQEAFNYPQEQINWLTGVLRGVPYNTTNVTSGTSNTATAQASPNPWGQALGLAASVASMFARS